ncbi:LodA/GoxA family CTQ-dependent oxidase [uncultured Cedecea sp.]|uniref:LodA/GoxA family CTQ-dependent oxidase n=1 Tax=uncultured Cedecea sp. TaxID=988762 RepID=UPI002625702C|nr:LodA/GoxA family CTQ-dependent oxidase [uncultured Cedecea sp.]
MNSRSTEDYDTLPAVIIKNATNNEVSLNRTGLIVIIPAEAGMKHYDLLTIYWRGKEAINKSYPKAITQQREGKNFIYQIPLGQLENHPLLDIWYSFHRVGTGDIKTSPVVTINISLTEEIAAILKETAAKKNQQQKIGSRHSARHAELSCTNDQRKIDDIVYAKIHPAIGIGRVGNSEDEYYIGPEYLHEPPPPFGATRDDTGAIKRQAARFRIYGYNEYSVAVAELTADSADITWKVELANKKASWYCFDNAMDQPAGNSVERRNPLITGAQRKTLEITPSPQTITGADQSGVFFDDGKFKNVTVELGELQTDGEGRLLVLGGHGISGSPSGAPLLLTDASGREINFNNSVDWYDDTSDGPVSAKVIFKGKNIPVVDAWVVIGPPDYAPGIVAFRSMYDMIKHSTLEPEQDTSYTNDIVPLLFNLSNLQWVNVGFARVFGEDGLFPIDSELIKTLAKADSYFERFEIFERFRAPDDHRLEGGDKMKWPQLYGDVFEGQLKEEPGALLPVSAESYEHLVNFVNGDFINDLKYDEIFGAARFPTQFYAVPVDELPAAMQPKILDKAPLAYCCADAFHPGCELTWPMRHASLYSDFLRIKRREEDCPERDYGDILTPDEALSEDGPLHAQSPGGLSRWMAVPWQGDTARCRSGYDKDFHPYLPSFWPAKVPNEVLSEAHYDIYFNDHADHSAKQRKEAFQTRDYWQRGFLLEGLDNEAVMQMTVDRFDELGIVQRCPASDEDRAVRDSVFVEQLKPGMEPFPPSVAAFSSRIDGSTVHDREALLKQLGWTQEQWDKFRRTR